MRLTRALLAAALATGIALGSVPPALGDEQNPVDSWGGALTAHVPGYPLARETGARVLVGGDVTLSAQTSRLTGKVTLAGPVDPATPGRLLVLPGALQEGVCVGNNRLSTDLVGEVAAGVSVSGSTVSFDVAMPMVQVGQTYDCLNVDVYRRAVPDDKTANDFVVTDRMTGVLGATLLTQSLQTLPTQKVPAVRGRTTTTWVTVRNTGEVDLTDVRLSGRAKGVRLGGSTALAALDVGRTASFKVTVKLTGRARKVPVPLTVTAGGARHTTTLRVVRVAKARPVPAGKYRSADSRVALTVEAKKNRRWITKLTAKPSEQCKGDTIEFTDPIEIPVGNAVDVWAEGSAEGYVWDQNLRVRFSGRKATGVVVQDAQLLAGCTAEVPFTARRR